MRKIIAILVLVVVIIAGLVLFFYPKDCGSWAVVPGVEATEGCDCLGYKTRTYKIRKFLQLEPIDGSGSYTCFGAVTQE